jgi:hypothetical protein
MRHRHCRSRIWHRTRLHPLKSDRGAALPCLRARGSRPARASRRRSCRGRVHDREIRDWSFLHRVSAKADREPEVLLGRNESKLGDTPGVVVMMGSRAMVAALVSIGGLDTGPTAVGRSC